MAVEANTYQTFTTKGIKEDLSDIIERIAPTDTPFLNSIDKETASSAFVEWQTQDLASVTDNAQVEGDQAANGAVTPTQRLGNYCQISSKVVAVSGTNEATKAAGRKSEMGYQLSLKSAELKRDQESALCSAANGMAGAVSNAAVTATHVGNGTTIPRRLRGIEGWVTDNVNLGATGVAASYAMGSWTAPVDGTARALTEALFMDVAQKCYDAGGQPDMVLTSSKQRSVINNFTGNGTKFTLQDKKLQATFSVYESPFGAYKLVNSRFVRNSVVHFIQADKWALAVLRPYKVEDIAKDGDSIKKQVITEYTLKAKAPNANGSVKALS